MTWHEMGYWDCETTLWGRAHQIAPEEPKAQLQLAFLYNNEGDTPKALAVLDEGLHYRPNSPNIWLARANILYGDGQYDLAREAFLKVMQVTEPAAGQAVPPGAPARLRAAAAHQLSVMDISAKNFAEAEFYARSALSLNFNAAGYHSVLSQCLRGEGKKEEALAENALEMRLVMAQHANNQTHHP
jgi:tetratricopeptide (TPR) repeat protein